MSVYPQQKVYNTGSGVGGGGSTLSISDWCPPDERSSLCVVVQWWWWWLWWSPQSFTPIARSASCFSRPFTCSLARSLDLTCVFTCFTWAGGWFWCDRYLTDSSTVRRAVWRALQPGCVRSVRSLTSQLLWWSMQSLHCDACCMHGMPRWNVIRVTKSNLENELPFGQM